MRTRRVSLATFSLLLLRVSDPAPAAGAPLIPKDWKMDSVARHALVYAPGRAGFGGLQDAQTGLTCRCRHGLLRPANLIHHPHPFICQQLSGTARAWRT